jgi:hypothetical protein
MICGVLDLISGALNVLAEAAEGAAASAEKSGEKKQESEAEDGVFHEMEKVRVR